MQLVIAAMTTLPLVTSAAGPVTGTWVSACRSTPSVGPPSVARRLRSRWGTTSGWSSDRNASLNDGQTPARLTRSCGRFGPARLGSTADRSRSRISVKAGAGSVSCRNRPWALRVAFGQVGSVAAIGLPQVGERVGVDGKQGGGRSELRGHVADGGPVGDCQVAEPRPEELQEHAHHTVPAQHLGDGQHQVGGGGPRRQRAGSADARRPWGASGTSVGPAWRPRPRCRPRPNPAPRAR